MYQCRNQKRCGSNSCWLLSCPPSHRGTFFPRSLDMSQHSQSYFSILALIPGKWPKKLYRDRWCTGAKSGRVGRRRQSPSVLTVRDDMFAGDSQPFSSHCQGTHSSGHSHVTFSLSSATTTQKRFAILLTDRKNFLNLLGKITIISFFGSVYLILKNT